MFKTHSSYAAHQCTEVIISSEDPVYCRGVQMVLLKLDRLATQVSRLRCWFNSPTLTQRLDPPTSHITQLLASSL